MSTQTETPGSITDRALQTLREVQEGTEKTVKGLMDKGESYGKEGIATIKERIAPAVRLSETILHRAKDNAEWAQDKIEESVQRAFGTFHLPTAGDLAKLGQSVQELSTQLVEMAGLRQEVQQLRATVDGLSKNFSSLERKLRRGGAKAGKGAKQAAASVPEAEASDES